MGNERVEGGISEDHVNSLFDLLDIEEDSE